MTKKKPSTLQQLKNYCEETWDHEAWRLADDDLENESDRGLVILSATRIEDALKHRLKEAMPNMDKKLDDELFGPMKPLSSFSSQIHMVYALDIVDKDEWRKLNYIREIRNRCAHSDKHLSFARKELRNAAKLIVPDNVKPYAPNNFDDQTAARYAFLGIASYFVLLIHCGRVDAVRSIRRYAKEVGW